MRAGNQLQASLAVVDPTVGDEWRCVVRPDGDSEDRLGHGLAVSPFGATATVITKVGKLLRHAAQPDQPIEWAPFAIPAEDRECVPDDSFVGARRSFDESRRRIGVQDKIHRVDPKFAS